MEKALKELCYITKGSGSTKKATYYIVKNRTDENVEAAELLLKTMFQKVCRSSFGTFFVE